jgi:hypothetical protein
MLLRAAVESLQRDSERKQLQDELRQSLLEADAQIERSEFQDSDEAFDEVEVELFGKRLADE